MKLKKKKTLLYTTLTVLFLVIINFNPFDKKIKFISIEEIKNTTLKTNEGTKDSKSKQLNNIGYIVLLLNNAAVTTHNIDTTADTKIEFLLNDGTKVAIYNTFTPFYVEVVKEKGYLHDEYTIRSIPLALYLEIHWICEVFIA